MFAHFTVICHLMQSVFNWKVLRNDMNKKYYCVWCWCRYPQGLQTTIHNTSWVSVFYCVTSWCSVENGLMNWATFWHGSLLSPLLHCVKKPCLKSSKITVLPTGTLSQTLDIENFVSMCRLSKCVIILAQQSGCLKRDKLHCLWSCKLTIGLPPSSDARPLYHR